MSITEKFRELNPTSKEVYDRAVKVMPSGNTRGVIFYRPYPAYARKGKGSRIWDLDGNERIDYCFNYSVLLLGHAHPKVMAAIKEQLECGTALGAPTELEVKLAEKIVEMVPCVEKVRFTVTGTEAVMNAIRVARAYTRKDKIVMFEGAYHGTSDSVVVKGASYSSEGIPDGVAKDVIVIPFNDAQMVERTIKRFKDEIAAVIVEPVLGAGGGIPPRNNFLEVVRGVTEEHGALLIFDEIQTGFRLAPGGAQELFNVIPDIVTLGKGVTGGLPGAAIGGSEELMDEVCSFPDVSYPLTLRPRVPLSGTHNAHPLSMAAGLAQLNELKPPVYDHINKIGQDMRDELSKICRDLGIKAQITGIGSFFHIFFTKRPIVSYGDTKYADLRLLWYFDIDLLNRGVYLAPLHCCYVSAATSNDDVKQTLQAMEQALTNMKPLIREICPSLIV